ncbi:MAG: hypothetical protein EOO04_09470 [Chitinophagaceae bacterium]|nr:MAG: hypothetical protein EOO04_09470 [Chitinophagaceae bacterium]
MYKQLFMGVLFKLMCNLLVGMLLILLLPVGLHSQSTTLPGTTKYSYYPPRNDKESWQRLYLLLSGTYINVVNEGQVDLDSALIKASRSLGLSRFAVLAEGFGDPELLKQSQWIDRQDPSTGIRLLSELTGRRHLQLLLLLGSYYAFQPGFSQQSQDSAKYFLDKAIEDSKSLKEAKLGRQALCLLGKIYIEANENQGDSIYNTLLKQCRKAGDRETEAKVLVYRSRFTPPAAATFQRKIDDSKQAVDIYRTLKSTEGAINALTDIGYLLTVSGQLQPAHDIFLEALNLAESIHFPYIHYNVQALSMITTFQGKFGEPLRYSLQMIKVAENCRDSIGWGYFHSNLSVLLKLEGRSQESLEVSEKAIEHFLKERNPTLFNLLVDVINHMSDQGRAREALELTLDIAKKVRSPVTLSEQFFFHYAFATCYLHLNQLDLAEMHVTKMDSMETKAEAIRGPLRRSAINYQLGLLAMKKGEYRQARQLFENHFGTVSIGMRTLLSDLDVYRRLIFVDSMLGDNESAIAHYKKYTQLMDSNFQVTKIRQAEELQVGYQINEKETKIASLTQQAQLEKANSDRASLIKNLTLAGIIATIGVAILLFRQNRLKQKANKVITLKNEELEVLITDKEKLLKDKEWLMKEIHHRVKNNLQIVMSLLNSQSTYIDNDAALNAIHDSRRRVHAMALIHQKLYQSENIAAISMPGYINELVNYVRDSFDTGSRVIFEQDIEAINLDVSQAIPLGLIINEGIVNAIKYAFPDGRNGIVRISLQQEDGEFVVLTISDNGIGMAKDPGEMEHNSLGLDLMMGLSKQLNGNFEIKSQDGLQILVRFLMFHKSF